jgi:hypothetical protein
LHLRMIGYVTVTVQGRGDRGRMSCVWPIPIVKHRESSQPVTRCAITTNRQLGPLLCIRANANVARA